MKKTVTLELNRIAVEVDVPDEMKDKEVLELAKAQLVKNLTKKFHSHTYIITEGILISEGYIKEGRPVRLKSGERSLLFTPINQRKNILLN